MNISEKINIQRNIFERMSQTKKKKKKEKVSFFFSTRICARILIVNYKGYYQNFLSKKKEGLTTYRYHDQSTLFLSEDRDLFLSPFYSISTIPQDKEGRITLRAYVTGGGDWAFFLIFGIDVRLWTTHVKKTSSVNIGLDFPKRPSGWDRVVVSVLWFLCTNTFIPRSRFCEIFFHYCWWGRVICTKRKYYLFAIPFYRNKGSLCPGRFQNCCSITLIESDGKGRSILTSTG